MRAEDYEVRRLTRDNLVDLVPLFRDVWGRRTDEARLLRKYDTSYLGLSYFGFIAYDERGRPVAFQGAVPTRLEHRGRVEIGAQSGDTMTVAGHRGRGLFTYLARRTDELLAESGIHFIWGFPNQASERGFLERRSWRAAARMRCFVLPTRAAPLERLARAVGLARRYRNAVRRRLAAFAASEAHFANSAAEEDAVVTRRDAEYLAYKLRRGSQVVELESCRIWLKLDRDLLIGDLEPLEEAVVSAALVRLKHFARVHGIARIVFQGSPGTRHERLFAKTLEGFDTWLLSGRSFNSSFPLERLRCTYGDVDTF